MRATLADGINLLIIRRYEEAVAALSDVATRAPDDSAAYRWLLFALIAIWRHDEAIGLLDRAAGMDAAQRQRLRASVEHLMAVEPGRGRLSGRGDLARRPRFVGGYEQNVQYALNVLRCAPAEQHPTHAALAVSLMDSLLWEDRFDDGAQTLNNALQEPNLTPVERSILLTMVAQVRVQSQDVYESIGPLRQALEQWPRNRAASFLLGRAYHTTGQRLRLWRMGVWMLRRNYVPVAVMPP